MKNFEKVIRRAKDAEAGLAKKKRETQTAEGVLAKRKQALFNACKATIIKAIREYNEKTHLKLSTANFGNYPISFDLKKREISISATMIREPNETLGDEDETIMKPLLSEILNREFERAGIPFTLGNLRLPLDYYGK